MKPLKRLISWLISKFGRRIRDERTGEFLGRALVLNLPGRTWLIGLHRPYVRVVFLPNSHNRYAQARLGFATHPPVDFPRKSQSENFAGDDVRSLSPINERDELSAAPRILWAILFHQDASACQTVLDHWQKLGFQNLLAVHGGCESDFCALAHARKVFVEDRNLRTRRHPVEKQSYSGPLREISRWLESRPEFSHIALVEYDHLPISPRWGSELLNRLSQENADVLFHGLERVDGTNAPHYLHHLSDPAFLPMYAAMSTREDPGVILDAMATGSFWRRDAFLAVAAHPETTPSYLEMHLPTTAHHLGYRVRDLGDQNRFVHFDPLPKEILRTAAAAGAWAVHPVKEVEEKRGTQKPEPEI